MAMRVSCQFSLANGEHVGFCHETRQVTAKDRHDCDLRIETSCEGDDVLS